MESIQEMADRLKLERWRKGCSDGHRAGADFKSGEIHSVMAPWVVDPKAFGMDYRSGWNHGFAMGVRGDALPTED